MSDKNKFCASINDFMHHFADLQYLLPPRRLTHTHWMSHVPFAFWAIDATRPSLLVELGSYTGVSFSAFCQQVERLGINTNCYAVDTWQGDNNMGSYNEEVYTDFCAFLQRNFSSFAYPIKSSFDDCLELFKDNSIDFLHIDGYHAYEAMLHDFETWLPKMSSSGVILMHDINARIPGYGGVHAWEEISSRFPSFSFTHGYGLGVVLVGQDPPERLQTLTQLVKDADNLNFVRAYFSKLGAIYENILEQHNTLSLAELRHKTILASEAEKFQQIIAAGQVEKNYLHNLIRGYEESNSWRITRPLRILANYLRKLKKENN